MFLRDKKKKMIDVVGRCFLSYSEQFGKCPIYDDGRTAAQVYLNASVFRKTSLLFWSQANARDRLCDAL